MTSTVTIQKEIKKIRGTLGFKPDRTLIVRMWLPDSDPKHGKTDDEIIREERAKGRGIIALPLREEMKTE